MAILSSIFGRGTPTPQVPGQVISTENIPKELQPYYKDILTKAQALYNDRVADQEGNIYQGQTLAEFTPEQQQAQTGIAGLVGTQAPVYQEAMGMTRDAATPFSTEQIEEYMSPYQQAVTDIEKREATKQYQTQVVPQLAAKAAMTQPFGGSRQAILEGMAADTQQRLLSDLQAKGSANAYTDAISRLDADRLAKGQAGTQLANLGTSQYKASAAELGGLQLVGENKQRQNQTALNESFKQFLDEREQPYVDMAKYQDVVRGAPIGTTKYSDPTPASYGPSLGTQLLGGIGGLNNIYGAFSGKNLAGQTLAPGQTGGGIDTLIKKNQGGTFGIDLNQFNPKEEDEKKEVKPESVGGFDIIRNSDGSINALAMQNAGVETYLKELALNRKARDETKRLSKVDLDKSKSYLQADRDNAQFNREQAAFTAMAKLGTDQDVTDAPGGGVGQILTMLGKAGPEIGAAEAASKANIRAQDEAVSKLELQYQQALSAGDLEAANGYMDMIKKVVDTQSTATAAIPTAKTNQSSGLGYKGVPDLAGGLFATERDKETNNWIMPNEYIKEYNNVLNAHTKFTTGLQKNPSLTINIGGQTITVDVAKDLFNIGGQTTLQAQGYDTNKALQERVEANLVYLIADKLGYRNIKKPNSLKQPGDGPMTYIPNQQNEKFIALDNAETLKIKY